MVYVIYSRYQQKPPLPHYLEVMRSNAASARAALEYYLVWLEGGGAYDIGLQRGTHVNYPIVETRRHYYFKRNCVLTFVRK